MPILKSSPKQPKNETLQLRIEGGMKQRLAKYAEFIDSTESYVVSEALKLIFRKDDEFREWLERQDDNTDSQQSLSAPNLFEGKK